MLSIKSTYLNTLFLIHVIVLSYRVWKVSKYPVIVESMHLKRNLPPHPFSEVAFCGDLPISEDDLLFTILVSKPESALSFPSPLPVPRRLGPSSCSFCFSGSSTCSRWEIPAHFRNGYPARVKIQIRLAQLEKRDPLGKEQRWKWWGRVKVGGNTDDLKLEGNKNIEDRIQRYRKAAIPSGHQSTNTYHSFENVKKK